MLDITTGELVGRLSRTGGVPCLSSIPNLVVMRRFASALIALGLVVAACGDDNGANPGALQQEVESLVSAAEDVRGLEFFEEPNVVVVSTGELADRVRRLIEEELDPDEVAYSQALYELLGLLDGSVELADAYTELYAESVGGYYDDDTGEMVVAGDLGPLAKTIVVHELIHALTDQHFGFAATLDEMIEQQRYEEASALQALVEGDATYFQLVYMQTMPTSEQVEAVQESLAADTSISDSLPSWFSEDLTWPYDAGFAFVDRLVTDLGVSGLNQAYTLFPTTTEHIQHPGSYFTRQPPRTVTLPDASLDGYDVVESGSWGEWNLELYLFDGVDPGEAKVASAGWGGDAYRIYWDGTSVAFAYLYLGDTPQDALEVANTLADSARARMAIGSGPTTASGTTFTPGDDYAVVVRNGSSVLLVVADDTVAGSQLTTQLRSAVNSG